ncbi:hypothetical protein FQR65_LT15286 [Abscondita terminalis]|nr:hypothetical protein FQR65_LT15286 [Abscondita terminalis]
MGIYWAKEAAKSFEGQVEVVDLRTLVPMDEEYVYEVVKKHGKCIELTEEQFKNSFGRSSSSKNIPGMLQIIWTLLSLPVGALNVPAIPINIDSEKEILPNPEKLRKTIENLLNFGAQQNSEATSVHQSIQSETDKVFNKLVEIRRDLHENPELAGHEVRTQKLLEKYLLDLGLEVQKDLYGHSLIGILKGGKKGKKSMACRYGCSSRKNPTVFNDKNLTSLATETLEKIYGKTVMVKDYGQVPYFNDDFAFFQQKKQGVYFLLGGSNLKKGIIAMNHTPDFEVDEESIRNGVKSFSSLFNERLK